MLLNECIAKAGLPRCNKAVPRGIRNPPGQPENERFGTTQPYWTKGVPDGPSRADPEIPYTRSKYCSIARVALPENGMFKLGRLRRGARKRPKNGCLREQGWPLWAKIGKVGKGSPLVFFQFLEFPVFPSTPKQ